MTMDTTAVTNQIKSDEGWSAFPYLDSEGFETIGYGFLIDESRSGGLPKEVGEYWLKLNIEGVVYDLHKRLPWFERQPQVIKEALVNMAYQLGTAGLLGFHNMLAAIEAGEYAMAADEALDSLWAEQTPLRARRIAEMIRSAA